MVGMLRVGLTGGIAAGKSTASQQFAKLGAVVIDYDQLAREAVAPGSPVLQQIADQLGSELIDSAGNLGRAQMAAKVFVDPRARQTLETLIHPRVFELAAVREAEAVRENPDAVVVHDVPLLIEKNLAQGFDAIVIVDTEEAVRERRLVEGRGLTEAEARARIAAGATDKQRREAADYILEGSGSAQSLADQVTDLWAKLIQQEPRYTS